MDTYMDANKKGATASMPYPLEIFGGADRIRTGDLRVANAPLSQLSYSPFTHKNAKPTSNLKLQTIFTKHIDRAKTVFPPHLSPLPPGERRVSSWNYNFFKYRFNFGPTSGCFNPKQMLACRYPNLSPAS